jgi:hypothetical protein
MEHWLGDIPSPQTRKNYKNGIKKFEEYYGKPIEALLELSDEELGHEINKYFSWLKQSHPQNTCRNRTNTVIQYLKHFGKNPKYKKNLGIFTTTLTTLDHMLTVDEARKMWTVASIDEKVMIKTWLLGARYKSPLNALDIKESNNLLISRVDFCCFSCRTVIALLSIVNCCCRLRGGT